jgi:hypothetical protein
MDDDGGLEVALHGTGAKAVQGGQGRTSSPIIDGAGQPIALRSFLSAARRLPPLTASS